MQASLHIVLDPASVATLRSRVHGATRERASRATLRSGWVRALRASVDLVLAGRSATPFLAGEPIVPLLRALADAVASLATDQRTKVLVPLATVPWELALESPDAHTLFVTVYQVVAPGDVTVDSLPVPLPHFAAALVEAMDSVLTVLDDLGEVGLPTSFRSARATLVDRVLSRDAAPPPGRGRHPSSTPVRVETSAMGGLVLATRMDAEDRDLLGYDGAVEMDRHVLRATGEVAIASDASAGVRVACRPIVVLDELLRRLALHLTLDRRPERVWTLIELPGATMTLEPGPVRSHLRVMQGGRERLALDMPTEDLLLALVDHVGAAILALRHVNPWLETNLALVDTMDRCEELRATIVRAFGMRAEAPTAPPGARIRHEDEGRHAVAPRIRQTGVRWEDAERLHYRMAWRREIAQTVPDGVQRCGDTLIVRCATRLLGIDAATGDLRWETRRPASVHRFRLLVVDDVVFVDTPEGLERIDPASGESLRAWTDAPAAGTVSIAPWTARGAPAGSWIAVGSDGTLACLSPDGRAAAGPQLARGVAPRFVWSRGELGAVVLGLDHVCDLVPDAEGGLASAVVIPLRRRHAVPFVGGSLVAPRGERIDVLWVPGERVLLTRPPGVPPGTRWLGHHMGTLGRALGPVDGVLVAGHVDRHPPEAEDLVRRELPVRTHRLPAEHRDLGAVRLLDGARTLVALHAGERVTVQARTGRTLATLTTGIARGPASFGWIAEDCSVVVGTGTPDVNARGRAAIEVWQPVGLLVPLE